MIYLIASLKIRPGSLEAVIAAAKPCIEATRKEAGCLRYDLFVSISDPESLTFVEHWQSKTALESHFSEPHLDAWRAGLEPHLLERKIEVITPEHVETR